MTVSLASAAEVALGRQRAPQHEVGPYQVRYLRSANVGDGVLDLTDVKVMNFTPAEQRIFELRPGDVLLTEGSGSRDTVGASAVWMAELDGTVCFQNTLLRLRPRNRKTDGRYLAWWARHAHASGMFAAVASGANILHLGAETLRAMQVHLPPLDEQRRIADFLDDQVVRINDAISLREHEVRLLEEKRSVLLDDATTRRGLRPLRSLANDWSRHSLPEGWRVANLAQVLRQLTNGYVGPTRDILVPDGVPYLQSLHIKQGAIDFGRRPYFVSRSWHLERPRISLREGDVLIVQTGDLGQVAVVPRDFGPASCHALLIARVRQGAILPEYLAEYLRSPFGRASLLSRATGALHPHLEGSIRAVPVILPPIRVQHELLTELESLRRDVATLASLNRAQIDLLHERKRALITAAVTGEFDVSSAGLRAAAAVLA